MTSLLLFGLVGQIAPLDLRIEGDGYLRFAFDGRIVYAKSASITVRDGRLSTRSGASLMPLMLVPNGATRFGAESDGRLFAIIGSDRKEIGRLTFAIFSQSESLTRSGEFSIAKSRPRLEFPSENGVGKLVSSQMVVPRPTISNASNHKPSTETLGTEIRFPSSVELDGGRMTLDRFVTGTSTDLAQKLKLADFGPIPSPGFPTRITRTRILAKLQFAGINSTAHKIEIPESIEVSAAGQSIDGKRFVEAALAGIAEKFGQAVELKLEGEVLPYVAPKGSVEFKTEGITQREKTVVATIALFVDGRRINSKQITFTGEQAAIAIKANELVKVVLRANGVAIETTGRAKKAGRIGEAIEIEIVMTDSNSKSTHLGTVKGPGLVEVKI